MVTNSAEREATVEQIERYEKASATFDERPEAHPGVHARLVVAEREAIANHLANLRSELAEFDLQNHSAGGANRKRAR